MVATGAAIIEIVFFADTLLHPVLFVTVTPRVTDPDLEGV
jgi:hypothetical protein